MANGRPNEFFKTFRNAIVGARGQNDEECDLRIKFILHNLDMLPKSHRELIFSLTRSYPTPPIYAFLMIGILGTNITRYSAIARPGCHNDQGERSGAFYKLIAESRLGKGVAMNLLWTLGSHIQKIREAQFPDEVNMSTARPRRVFLPGGNGIQTHSEAAKNAGCGIIFVPEIKTGKSKYTDIDGSYGPLLSFYDKPLPGITFRKAEDIKDVDNCRVQIVAAGVVEDWTEFVNRSGEKSGTLARVLPV